MVSPRSALFRYYNRIPMTGSSSSSSGVTPTVLLDGSSMSMTSNSVAGCSSVGTKSLSVCDNPRKRKVKGGAGHRRRSNPAVKLLTVDADTIPACSAPCTSDSVADVIVLSSEGSVEVGHSESNVNIAGVDAPVVSRVVDKGKLPMVEEEDEFSDDDIEVDVREKVPKKNYDATRKFQETWSAKLPWAELFRGSDGLFQSVKCVVCSQITGKPKILGPKWDTLVKHSGKRKATKDMAPGIKKGQWYVAKNCKHLRYERLCAARNSVTVAEQLAVVKGERARKRLQFATILHLLQEGRPMLEYAALVPLLNFLAVPKLPKRHWSDSAGWALAECLHHQVQLKTQEVMGRARFFSVTCDEVTTLDTQSWISIHGYVCEDWERKAMLLSLERVVDGGGSDNLTSVIVGALKNQAGIKEDQLVSRFASFGADGVSTFQGTKNGVVNQLKNNFAPRMLGIHCMAHRTNLAVRTLSSLPVVERIEEMLTSLHAFFAKSPKRHLEFVKLAELMQSKGLKILKNVKTRWISMLSPAVRVMCEYRPLIVKMSTDSVRPVEDGMGSKAKVDKKLMEIARKNLEHLTDIQILLGLSGLLPLLKCVHSLMQFAQARDVFVCDYVSAIQMCISEVFSFYLDDYTAFTHDVFFDFKGLVGVRHEAIPMSWVQGSFDLNVDAAEVLHFTPTGHSIPATYREAGKQTIHMVTKEVYADIVHDVKQLCREAAEKLIAELEGRFPSSSLMDAFGFVYPQYWLRENAESDFDKHITVIKEHYGLVKTYALPKKGGGSLGQSFEGTHVEQVTDSVAPVPKSKGKDAPPVLSIPRLDEQACMFKIAMKANCHAAMQGDLPLNPLTRLWRRIEANSLLRHKLSEYMKVVELAVVTVLGSVEDERTFSTLSFMKNKLRNRLSTHLPLVVGMHAQEFYSLDDFPYDAAYDEWKASVRKGD